MARFRRPGAFRRVGIIALLTLGWCGQAWCADDVILNANRHYILAGRYSVFADFQRNLQRVLDDCGKATPVVVPKGKAPSGKIAAETREAIQAALACKPLHGVAPESSAKDGILTVPVWHAVMGEAPAPTLQDRVIALVLSYEGTDFGDPPEWNLCQDSKGQIPGQPDATAPGFVCFNASDPCSLLTWGPRGATAGSGREIQWILWMAWKQEPALIERAFGREFSNVRRFLRLKSGPTDSICTQVTPLKRFMCAVWVDPERRKIWEDALGQLGHSQLVRRTYDRLYALREFDGDKLRAFFELWRRLGLTPNEVDYAFFIDRITHLDGPPSDPRIAQKLAACIASEAKALLRNGAARRCLARAQPHETQPELRAARDVGFYLEAYPDGSLSEAEIKGWASYVPLSAALNFGLSETKNVEIANAKELDSLGRDLPLDNRTDLTETELKGCPATVLAPVRRRPQE
jgi:hypothetical protein